MPRQRIHKGDSKQTRHAKKTDYNRIKRKDKLYRDTDTNLVISKRGKFHRNNKGRIRFSISVEKFFKNNEQLASKKSKLSIKLNDSFSLFQDPSKVLLSLIDFLKHGKNKYVSPAIEYDGHVSFGAIYLLDNLSYEIKKQRTWRLRSVDFPEDELSILSNIRSFTSSVYEDDKEHMINEKILINRKENTDANQKYRAKATDITNMIQNAIRVTSENAAYSLPLEIHDAIKSTIGEQFDNILYHSSETDIGTLCGFFNKSTKEITLLIYNFGKTIAESLVLNDLPYQIANDIKDVIKVHTKNSLFDITKNREFTAENALTLLALQEGISSRLKYDKSRGHGLIDFIEKCLELTEDSKICVISGMTAIKIDKTYPIGNVNVWGRDRRIVACNSNNNIYQKPDAKHVINTGVHFNGVIIETTIPLAKFYNGTSTQN